MAGKLDACPLKAGPAHFELTSVVTTREAEEHRLRNSCLGRFLRRLVRNGGPTADICMPVITDSQRRTRHGRFIEPD